MLGISTFQENPVSAAGKRENEEGGDGSASGMFGEEERVRDDEGDRNSAGNRWPREETLALLKIRSEMDVAFRDSALKAPLWEEVSRKLAELGYHRNPKKCKEKFENIYKYHKRTKEGRSVRPNGKMYRFFEQLQALDMNPPFQDKIQTATATATTAVSINPINTPPPIPNQNPSTKDIIDASTSTTSSSGDKESESKAKAHKKKRKMSDFFERLMKEVIEKQESLEKKFIEAIDKYERDRIAREEAWKMQETERLKREHELLVQERSTAAAKDAAVIAFLQKYSQQSGLNPVQLPENLMQTPLEKSTSTNEKQENSISHENYSTQTINCSSSRWPKAEVEALIRMRTNFDLQYQESGPKGPLWEEISAAMKKIGYDRSAKRCKEKWENINKYFKRVKESNKKRPEDSKTCPYFHQLDALYKEKSKRVIDTTTTNNNSTDNCGGGNYNFKPEDLLMQMMGHSAQKQAPESATEEDGESENNHIDDQNIGEEEEEEEEENGDEEEGDEEDERDNYRIVANDDPSSMAIMG